MDKRRVPVKDSPGFLVNRVLGPYMQNAFRMIDEGVKPETIDAAMEEFGMPMGPAELADTVGLDICLAAGKSLAKGAASDPKLLSSKVQAGNTPQDTSLVNKCMADNKNTKSPTTPLSPLPSR